MINKYVKKPIVIEAIQFINDSPETIMEINEFMNLEKLRVNFNIPNKPAVIIPTLEGDMRAEIGDYIIKGINGEFYPCKPDIFVKTYIPHDCCEQEQK